jgi:hypothetical protein
MSVGKVKALHLWKDREREGKGPKRLFLSEGEFWSITSKRTARRLCAIGLLLFLAIVAGLNANEPGEPIELPPMPQLNHIPEAGRSYLQRYEIFDVRFCHLTPDPFLCERCLRSDMQFVRLLRFNEEGRPERIYGCRPFLRPYVH